jgi:hypothetical protein
MKKTFTLIFALCSFFMFAKGQVILDETFNYSVANLALESTWTSGGTTIPGVGTGRNVITPALTYITTDGTYALSDLGKTINSDYTSGASDYYCYKAFTATPVTSTVYLSFMYNVGVAQNQSQSEVFGLGDGVGTGPKLWAGKGSVSITDYRLGLTRGSTTGADIKWGTTEFSDVAKVILVVIKYDFSTSTASLFINPILGSALEPAADAIDNTSSATSVKSKLSTLRFRYNATNAAKFNVGGVRVSSAWADAVAKTGTTGMTNQIQGKSSLKIYPNPASSKMSMDYNLAENTKVNLVVYNISGVAIKTLINANNHLAGSYSKSFDVSDLKSGIYFARFTAGKDIQSFKVLINR